MGFKLTWNTDKIVSKVSKVYEKKIDNFVDNAFLPTLNSNTPEDTGELISNNQSTRASKVGTEIKASVYNETEYGPFVESKKGVNYNYHKNGSVITTGPGAKMFEKTVDQLEDEFINYMK